MHERPAWKLGGAWLKDLRIASEITERELAEQIGVPGAAWVAEVESGSRAVPPTMQRAYARVLGWPPSDFIDRCTAYYGTGAAEIVAAA